MSTQGHKNRQRGKRHEKAIVKQLGGERRGVLGREDVRIPKEVFGEDLYIEAKSRDRFVAEGWMRQAESHTPPGAVPVVVTHLTRGQHENDLVILRLQAAKRLLKLLLQETT